MNSVNNIQQAAEGGASHSIQISVSFDDFNFHLCFDSFHFNENLYFEYQKSIISMRAIL